MTGPLWKVQFGMDVCFLLICWSLVQVWKGVITTLSCALEHTHKCSCFGATTPPRPTIQLCLLTSCINRNNADQENRIVMKAVIFHAQRLCWQVGQLDEQ
jgi:hypothetical protein